MTASLPDHGTAAEACLSMLEVRGDAVVLDREVALLAPLHKPEREQKEQKHQKLKSHDRTEAALGVVGRAALEGDITLQLGAVDPAVDKALDLLLEAVGAAVHLVQVFIYTQPARCWERRLADDLRRLRLREALHWPEP
eukprot:CAMPEP_0206164398 /NCGR_PEP_ID=MMETSP1474-20131121/16125_1 /ASSEMBLY_ACC=CAM_ASM_001110 /TAXON_ID=97495 /ORGANISM="Imantonia sp., Strain RCC918" /LENGTH=138 /DNA_ID=CAMNT_0053567253 /DNA_START=32 /DNA_END=446 /DNA_ORIENTATION=-